MTNISANVIPATEKQRLPVPGELVRCPADPSQPGYMATVESYENRVIFDDKGRPYVRVTVRREGVQAGQIWPSNRLGYILPPGSHKMGKLVSR